MSKMKLRTRIPISYYEPEDPPFDDYIFCDQCQDVVYEYCSLHGPMLVIPDDEVPPRHAYPNCIPRAALTIPKEFLHIASSIIPGAGLGVFATLTLPSGVRFGPFCGLKSKQVSSQYCWKIHDRNMRYKYVVDAADSNESNWMRYVNCARHWHEQNLVAYQYRGQMYYRTVKIIPRFTELMVFYGSEFAMALNIDLRNYNSENYCQTIVQRISHSGPIKKAITFSEENSTNEEILNMALEEANNFTNTSDLTPTTIENFVIVDTPEKSVDSKSHTNECMDTESHTSAYTSETENQTQNSFTNECMESHTKPYNTEINQQPQIPQRIKNLMCFICKNSYTTPYNLKRHYKLHGIYEKDIDTILRNTLKEFVPQLNDNQNINEIPLKSPNKNVISCNICGKIFCQNYNLKRHLYTVHDDTRKNIYQCKCNVCDKILKHKNNLRKHMHTHSVKHHRCTHCPFQTSFLYELKTHIQSHTQDKVYKCDLCTYSGVKRNNMTRHWRLHHK